MQLLIEVFTLISTYTVNIVVSEIFSKNIILTFPLPL